MSSLVTIAATNEAQLCYFARRTDASRFQRGAIHRQTFLQVGRTIPKTVRATILDATSKSRRKRKAAATRFETLDLNESALRCARSYSSAIPQHGTAGWRSFVRLLGKIRRSARPWPCTAFRNCAPRFRLLSRRAPHDGAEPSHEQSQGRSLSRSLIDNETHDSPSHLKVLPRTRHRLILADPAWFNAQSR
jgi:hypothetical protein